MARHLVYPIVFAAMALSSHANPAAIQMRNQMANQMSNQMHHQMMMQQMFATSQYAKESVEANMTSLFTVYAKDSVYTGLGALQTERASKLRGTKRRSMVQLDERRFMPTFTDSLKVEDPTRKIRKGIPRGENWIFIEESGRITAYSDVPGGPITHVSLAGGEIFSLEETKDNDRFEKELRTVPLAAYFVPVALHFDASEGRASESVESPLMTTAIRYYNLLHAKQAVPAEPVALDYMVSRLFTVDSITDYGYNDAKPKLKNPDDFVQMSVNAKYLCGKGIHAEAEPLIAKLDLLVPNFYGTYQIKGLCAQTRGDLQAAQTYYHKAYQYAPPRSSLLESYYRKLQRYKKILAETPTGQ